MAYSSLHHQQYQHQEQQPLGGDAGDMYGQQDQQQGGGGPIYTYSYHGQHSATGDPIYTYTQPEQQPFSQYSNYTGDQDATKTMASSTLPHPSEKPNIPHHNPRTTRHPFWSAWTLEFLALIISFASLAAAAAVLSRYDGERVEDWGPGFFSISLNTVISVLGVISKATLAFVISSGIGQHKWNWFRARQEKLGVFDKFEQASRGPWGSASLLLWSKVTNWAALGAFVTITALLVDPFLQATVSIRGQDDQTTSISRLPVAQAVNLGIIDRATKNSAMTNTKIGPGDNDMIGMDSMDTFPDFGLTSAVYDGFSHSSLASDAGPQVIRFQCSTGNCTWPLYTTAAVCSRCNDVSQKIIKRTNTTEDFSDENATDQTVAGTGNIDIQGQEFSYTSYEVAYAHIKQYDGRYGAGESGFGDLLNVLLTASINTHYLSSASFQDMNTTIATVIIMRAQKDFFDGKVNWEDSTPVATECGFYMCAKAYTASAVNGVLEESEVGTWAVREPKSWRSADIDATEHHVKASREDYEAYDKVYPTFAITDNGDMLHTDLQVLIPEAELEARDFQTGGSVQTRFNLSQSTIMSMSLSIRGLFTEDDSRNQPTYDGRTENFKVVYPNRNSRTTSLLSDILWVSNDTTPATQNLSSIFDSVANRLTIQMREANNVTHEGQAEAFVLHFHVNWGFFSVLGAILALGTLYFVGVLIQTYRSGLPAWKESAIPSLVYGLNDETQALLRKIDSGRWTGRSMDGGAPEVTPSAKRVSKWAREKVRDGVMVRLQDDVGEGYTLQMGTPP